MEQGASVDELEATLSVQLGVVMENDLETTVVKLVTRAASTFLCVNLVLRQYTPA